MATKEQLTPDELSAIWAVKKYHGQYYDEEDNVNYLHLFDCPLVKMSVDFGIANDGYCETCYHEYPAIILDVACKCKEVVIKSDIQLYGDAQGLPMILEGMYEIQEEFSALKG